MKGLVFLDTETTGLDAHQHQVWEIAWAYETDPVRRLVVPHSIVDASPEALAVNGYLTLQPRVSVGAVWREDALKAVLDGATIVGSNPSFDTSMLYHRWGAEPWHHRKLDLATYAMPYLGADLPVGLNKVAEALGVKQPDHTATQDVLTLRECFLRLRSIYRTTTFRKDNA